MSRPAKHLHPNRPDIAAPEFDGRMRWLNADARPRMGELCAAGPVLVHFFDFAQLNSVRALPYAVAWDERYRNAGLRTLGIHSPRFPFVGDARVLGPALERLGVRHPVAADTDYDAWHAYGCKGWPSLFLWGQGGALRWVHLGEGEYLATEEEIQAELRELDALARLPEPLAPLRATDAPGAMVAPPSAEVFPGGSVSEPWRGGSDAIELEYEAGGAHLSVAGTGELRAAIDGAPAVTIAVDAPGLLDVAIHPRHERHRLSLEADRGVEVYSVSFSPGLP